MPLYRLSNGDEVLLNTNTETAKFIYLVMPRLKVRFDGWTPTIRQTPEVEKIQAIAEKLSYRRYLAQFCNEPPLDFDDDIPF